MLQVFTDGSHNADASITKSAWVIKQNNEIIHQGSKLHGKGWSDIAEYQAVVDALYQLLHLELQDQMIEWFIDSQFVAYQLQGKWAVRRKKDYAVLYEETQRLLKQFSSVSFYWIPREENEEADAISKIA